MITSSLNGLKKKIENYNTEFSLYPSITQPPFISIDLVEGFRQYSYADKMVENEGIFFKTIPQTTNKISMLEGTNFLLNPKILDPTNEIDPTDTRDLFFNWTRNGGPLYEINSLNYLRGTGSVMYVNATRNLSGIYQLQVSNQYGTATTEELEIDIIDVNNHPFLHKNLLQNTCGTKGTENWIADPDITTRAFTKFGFSRYHYSLDIFPISIPPGSGDSKKRAQGYKPLEFRFQLADNPTRMAINFDQVKNANLSTSDDNWIRWMSTEFHSNIVSSEYPAGPCAGFFPSPEYLDIANKNDTQYRLGDIIVNNKTYITREKLKFSIYGGKPNSIAYQDVPISDISNIVDGQAYGIDKLYVHFFAYIGAGITRFKTKYVTNNGEYFEDNQIPVTNEIFTSGSALGYELKAPVIPFAQADPFVPYTEQQMRELILNWSENINGTPIVSFRNEPVQIANDPDIDFDGIQLSWYLGKILASGYWLGVVRGSGNTYEQINNKYRLWFTRLDNENAVQTPDNKRVKLLKIPTWLEPHESPELNNENSKIKRATSIKLSPVAPFEIEPVVDDTTDIRIDFLDENSNTLKSETLKGPTAKDVWAIKEKFFVPFYIANTYWWITNLTTQPIKIFNKTYTTMSAVRANDGRSGQIDLHAGYVKRYHYPAFLNRRLADALWNRVFMYDRGAAAMFGVSGDFPVPVNTRTIRVNVIFNHTSTVIYDNNPETKGWKQQEIYLDYLTNKESDKRYYEYGMPRCGITAMHMSLHPNRVDVDYKYATYKIPPGNVWYKHKQYLESDDMNSFYSVSTKNGGYQGNLDEIENLTYRYNIQPDDPITAFTQRILPDRLDIATLIANDSSSYRSVESLGILQGPPQPVFSEDQAKLEADNRRFGI